MSSLSLSDVGFVVKDRLDNVVAAYSLVNESELSQLVRETNRLGFVLHFGPVTVDDGGNIFVSHDLKKYTGQSLEAGSVLPRPEAIQAAAERLAPTQTADEIIKEAYETLLAAGENGVEQQIVLDLMGSVIKTTPAFTLRMKAYLATVNDKVVLERYSQPSPSGGRIRYRLTAKSPCPAS